MSNCHLNYYIDDQNNINDNYLTENVFGMSTWNYSSKRASHTVMAKIMYCRYYCST